MKPILNKAAAFWQKTDKTQLLRHGVQLLSFLLFPGLFLTVFNALRDVVVAIISGTFAFSALSGSLVTLAVVLGVTILWGRFFCGYMCTFGALQELLSFAGRKLLPGMRKVPARVDKLLKYVKYAVLLAVVLLVWALQLPVDSSLSPWGVFGALLSGNVSLMAEAVPTLGFGLLLAILVLSLFVERVFCRYLCPLGALFTPLSAARLFRIRRQESACIGCQQCTRECAMGVTVHEDLFVRSGECIDCMKCVAACHPQALKTLPHPAVAGTASALALCGLIQVGKLAVPQQTAAAPTAYTGDFSAGQVASAESASPSTRYVDGVYTGTGTGFRGTISAQVTVSGGRITDVTILSSPDDSDFFQRAQSGVIPAILQKQSVNVSAVTGATYSCRGILEAVANALQLDTSSLPAVAETHQHGQGRGGRKQAEGGNGFFGMTPPSGEAGEETHARRGQHSNTDQGAASGQDRQRGQGSGNGQGFGQGQGRRQGGKGRGEGQFGQDKAQPNGTDSAQPQQQAPAVQETQPAITAPEGQSSTARTYVDGVYTGTGSGYRGATQVQVTVAGGRITDVTILSSEDDRQYFSRAQSSLIAAILNAQGVDVSTVSGATFSSNGILEAVADALDIDFTNPNATLSRSRGGRGRK